jgi:putative endonuclease
VPPTPSDIHTRTAVLTAVDKTYAVYILTNDSGSLYISITSALEQRVTQHHLGHAAGFTEKSHLHRLVYYETTPEVRVALNGRNRSSAGAARRRPRWCAEPEVAEPGERPRNRCVILIGAV